MGVERAREALARLLLSDVPLRERLEAQWPYADKHLIAEAIERAALDFIENPCRFDAKRGKSLSNFLLVIALRRMRDLGRTEHRYRRIQQNPLLAGEAIEPFLSASAAAPSAAEVLMAAEDEAEAGWTRARRRELMEEFAQRQSPTDRQMLKLMREDECDYPAYADVLGIGDRPESEQREFIERVRDRLRHGLRRWMLKHERTISHGRSA
jgi:DNA-directed RNA polymerase specialized sigma24 family protein